MVLFALVVPLIGAATSRANQAATRVDCTPDADTNPEGFTHTVTCTMSDAGGGTVGGGQIDAEFLAGSPNDPGGNESGAPADLNDVCDAGESAAGQCSFTYTGNNPGTDVICAFVDEDANDDVDDADCAGEAGQGAEDADDADVVRKTWLRPARLDCTPETETNPTGSTHQINCSIFDANGNPINVPAGELVDFKIMSGPNSHLLRPGIDFECEGTTPTSACSARYTDEPGFDPGNTTDVICAWISHDGEDDEFPGSAPEDGGDCDNESTSATDDDETDLVLKTWFNGEGAWATQVNAEPETGTNPVGTPHTIGVSARGPENQPATRTAIRGDILPNSPNASSTTSQAEINCVVDTSARPGITFPSGQSQTHECTYSGGNPGVDTVRVFGDQNNNGIYDQGEPFDDVTKTWSGAPFAIRLTPEQDTATAGTCNEFTARVTDEQGNPVAGRTVDVLQVLRGAGTEPNETRELSFCNPVNPTGPNPTGQGGTAFGDVEGNNLGGTAGQPGRNTTVRAEVGPTDANGDVTFGITVDRVPGGQTATVDVRSWVDTGPDNDTFDGGEPADTAVKTWTPGEPIAVTSLDAQPETATNPSGTQHQVTVTVMSVFGPIPNVVPQSVIAPNAAGRPQGDVSDPNAGSSPNATPGNFNAYACTPSNAQGVSICTFDDSSNPGPAGTDTIVFYVNQAEGGTPGPDPNEPQDAVQKTWVPFEGAGTLDLRCAGTGPGDDHDAGEQGVNDPGAGIPDCTNPLGDADEVFTAVVTSPQGFGQANVRVDFRFGARANGNQAGADNSTDDATLNAPAGGQIGTSPGTLRTFCITDATGRCTLTLTNPSPLADDTIEVVGTISGAVGGGAVDGATKQWQAGVVNQRGTITLTPAAATNQIDTPHTVVATVRDQFGQAVPGADVDFRIVSGPNAGLAQAGMIDAVTDANGTARFTYTSRVAGTDRIVACTETGGTENDTCNAGTGGDLNGGAGGEPSAVAHKTWQIAPVTVDAVALDMDADEAPTVFPTTPGGCELVSSADPNRETTAQNTIDPRPQGTLAAGNFHRICAAAFQTNPQGGQDRLAGAQIAFTIQGPGRIFASNANGACNTGVQPAAGTTVTVTAGNDGYAFACLYSQQVGRTTVTAAADTPAKSMTGTKDWTVIPNAARFIQLCHGDVAGTVCETDEQFNETFDEHQMTARVTDAQGNPVAGVPVQFREAGPGIFTPQGGGTATVTTDADGLAAILLTSGEEGISTVVAEISPEATQGGFRNAGAGNDECEQPGGTNNQPAAGNCVSQTLTKRWDAGPINGHECDDALDNDGDGLIDFPEDPGCTDDADGSELPFNVIDEGERHTRVVSMRFDHDARGRNDGLVVFGRLRVDDGFNRCRAAQPINVQRRVNGRWVTKKSTETNRKGRYAVEIFDLASRYRAVAPRTEILDEQLNRFDVCHRAAKVKRHRHRR